MKVGLVYDPIYLEHDTGGHVENRRRLVETMALLEQSPPREEVVILSPQAASVDELLMVHTEEHISRVKSFSDRGGGWLDGDTVASAASYQVALYAVGGVIRGVDAVMAGEVEKAFALVRPPGHHATPQRAMGFCLFNNIAIAARYALQKHDLERILIADLDVHHGNGTQDIFYDDASVVYFSTHQYPWYPGTGAVEETGAGSGKGATVNVPLPAGCGDAEYQRVFQEVLVPLAQRFQPQLIMVSAGYDTHWADQLSLMQLSVAGFGSMVSVLKGLADQLCEGRIVLTLEGGYHLQALPYGIRATFEALSGSPLSADPLGPAPERGRPPSIAPVLDAVKEIHSLS